MSLVTWRFLIWLGAQRKARGSFMRYLTRRTEARLQEILLLFVGNHLYGEHHSVELMFQ